MVGHLNLLLIWRTSVGLELEKLVLKKIRHSALQQVYTLINTANVGHHTYDFYLENRLVEKVKEHNREQGKQKRVCISNALLIAFPFVG